MYWSDAFVKNAQLGIWMQILWLLLNRRLLPQINLVIVYSLKHLSGGWLSNERKVYTSSSHVCFICKEQSFDSLDNFISLFLNSSWFFFQMVYFSNTALNLKSCTCVYRHMPIHSHIRTHTCPYTHTFTHTHACSFLTKQNSTIRFAMKIDSYMFEIENKWINDINK